MYTMLFMRAVCVLFFQHPIYYGRRSIVCSFYFYRYLKYNGIISTTRYYSIIFICIIIIICICVILTRVNLYNINPLPRCSFHIMRHIIYPPANKRRHPMKTLLRWSPNTIIGISRHQTVY